MKNLENVRLSARMQAICDMVTPGLRAADVGCDHGFVPIYLVQKGICPYVLAMDVREGPLSMAREHTKERGLENYIETRLSDGLEKFSIGEAECLICAGMGGRLMQRILMEGGEKTKGLREMILQPQSELWEFRVFLRRQGFEIVEEKIVFEEGKYYFPMKAKPVKERETSENCQPDFSVYPELADRFGGLLLREKNPVLLDYLLQSLKAKEEIAETLSKKSGSAGAKAGERLDVIEREIFYLREAVRLY